MAQTYMKGTDGNCRKLSMIKGKKTFSRAAGTSSTKEDKIKMQKIHHKVQTILQTQQQKAQIKPYIINI